KYYVSERDSWLIGVQGPAGSANHGQRRVNAGLSPSRSRDRPDAIEPQSIFAEELPAIRQRHVGRGLLETAVEVVPGAFEPVHGKIRGKHAAVDTEDPDRLANDRLIGCKRPRLAQDGQAGDLAVDVVWQYRQRLHAPAPYLERL